MKEKQGILYILSGLPGCGKSTLARKMAWHFNAFHLRIDTIEQGLRDLCACRVQGEGYRLSYRIARENLELGLKVIADSVNPWELTRKEWRQCAAMAGAAYVDIEILCSDRLEHRRRIETRSSEVSGLVLPSWEDVLAREYHPWKTERIRLDTAGKTPLQSFEELVESMAARTLVGKALRSDC